MTRGDSARGRSAEIDGHAVGCSPKQASWADDGSVLKIPTVIPQRRQSLRLKEVKSIYKSEDALSSSLQQISVENIPSTSIPMEVENISPPDDPTINVSLKDLRNRCKSKKRKARTVASSFNGLHPPLVKPKEEEPDLDEPLIFLKLKRPNKSSTGRKQRKQSHVPDSIIPVEETFAQMTYISFSGGEDPSPVATERLSVFKKGAAGDGPNTISESTDENLEVTSDKDPLHLCDPALSDTVKKEVVETFDAVSSCSVFIGNSNVFVGSSATLDQRVSEEKSADGESRFSTSKILHPCITGVTEVTSSYCSPAISQMGARPLLNIPQSVDEVKSKVAGIDSLESKSDTYVYDSSELDFIGNYNDHGLSSELQKADRDGTECADVTSFTTKPMDCCVNEVSFEYKETNGYVHIPKSDEGLLDYSVSELSNDFMETDNYSRLTESSKEYHEEKIRLESSESSFRKLLPSFSKSEASAFSARSSQLVSETADLSLYVIDRATSTSEKLIHDNITSQIDNLAATDSQAHASEHKDMEYIIREDFQNREAGTPVPETSLCIHERNLAAEHSLLSGDIRDLHDASGFSEEIGSLDSLVRKAICGDARRNSTKNHVISAIDSSLSLKTCDLCDPLHSSESSGFSGVSHAANISSNGIENSHCSTIDEMLPRCAEKLANIGDAEELNEYPFERSSNVENCDPCISKHPDMSFSSTCDLHAANESTLRTESLHCPTQDQMLNSFSEDVATSEIEAEELGEVLHLHSPPVLPPDLVMVNDSLNVRDSLSKASKEIQSSAEAAVGFPEENSASSETTNLVQEEQAKRENELKCNQGMMVEHSPRKLLSNRKDLSPNSQEKLRRALNRNELDDIGKISNHEEMERMLKSEWVTKRSKSGRNGSPPLLSKGILKQQDSLGRNCSCSKNPVIHKQAQRAVIFSQRQMQDIENIATKLLNGLTSMKNIVEDIMGSEACSSASSNFTPEEIRMAIQNVSSLEATTQKWLSMMAKDCNRFCKIMKSTENKRAASLGGGKQSKKITFADEAGGSLCQVKVIEQLPASFVPR